MSLRKEDFTSFEITDLDGNRLYFTDSNFDFPVMYDQFDNLVENLLMIKGKKLPEIRKDQYIYVIATHKNGDRTRYMSIITVSSAYQLNIPLNPDKAEEMEERRRYFKIKTNERAYITFTVDKDENTHALEPPAEICIKDINVGGVLFVNFVGNHEFQTGDKAMIVLSLNGRRLELMSEILREQPLAEPTQKGYGCRFINLTRTQEEIISRYIYNLQFEMLQKERSMRD